MPGYKELYLKMFPASEQAINLLIAAQRECEERYILSPEPALTVVVLPTSNQESADEE